MYQWFKTMAMDLSRSDNEMINSAVYLMQWMEGTMSEYWQ
jgi:hypothetical protein